MCFDPRFAWFTVFGTGATLGRELYNPSGFDPCHTNETTKLPTALRSVVEAVLVLSELYDVMGDHVALQ